MSTLLFLITTVIATLDLMAFHAILKIVIVLLMPVGPRNAFSATYRAVSLERFGLVLFAICWLVSIILVYYYYARATTRRILLARFVKVTALELLVIAIGYLLPIVVFVL